jgi:GNAT superfamily N-acetyltransferase
MKPRVATVEDVPALVAVINRAYQVEAFFVAGPRTGEDEVRRRMGKPGACFLVIDAEDRDPRPGASAPPLAGAAFVELRGARGYLGMLSVDPDRQRGGLGRALVTAAEARCRAAGCRFLDIDVVSLRRELPPFYARLGFAAYDTAPFPEPARLLREASLVLMTKPLVPLF